MQSPCRNCTERHINCHSLCNGYKEYKKKCDSQRAIRNAEAKVTSDIIDLIREALRNG